MEEFDFPKGIFWIPIVGMLIWVVIISVTRWFLS
jgi:hypothetical protein